jgi:hypothetical protein
VQEISIVSGKAPEVARPLGTDRVVLTFEGIRESRTIADKLTRVRVTMRAADAKKLAELLTGDAPAF